MNEKNKNQINSGIYKKGEVTFENIIKSIKADSEIEEAGSILTFSGIVRKTSEDGKLVNGLIIDAYEELANKTIEEICSDINKENGIINVKIIHLIGEFSVSEDLVYVVVASAHRKEGFQALMIAVERYKKEISVWKKEMYINSDPQWIH